MQRIDAELDARRPCGLVAELRRAGDAGAMTSGAGRVEDLLAVGLADVAAAAAVGVAAAATEVAGAADAVAGAAAVVATEGAGAAAAFAPSALAAGASALLPPLAGSISTSPTGLMRLSTALPSVSDAVETSVTYCESRMMTEIGTRKASTTTTTSCFQFLIGETWWAGPCMGFLIRKGESRREFRAHWKASENDSSKTSPKQNGALYSRSSRSRESQLDARSAHT